MRKLGSGIHMDGLIFLAGTIFQILLTTHLVSSAPAADPAHPAVKVVKQPNQVILDNGILQVTISVPQGHVMGIKYNGLEDVLDKRQKQKGYWDVVWNTPYGKDTVDKLEGTTFKFITETEDLVELSVSRTWSGDNKIVPVNIDKRFIVRRGVPGLYMYGIFERLHGYADGNLDQMRIAIKLNPQLFKYVAVSDDRQRKMPTEADRDINSGRAKALAYREAVLLVNPEDPSMKGEVDDKYMYTVEDMENRVHGWVAESAGVGLWMICPSSEFRGGGPIKQALTSHTGPTTIANFNSMHYVGTDSKTWFTYGESWKKVFGPVFIYLNSAPPKTDPRTLWNDAKRQMMAEVDSWPYDFVRSPDYPLANERGTVSGQILVRDRFVNPMDMEGKGAYVGLAEPGEAGSWTTEMKGYQFWVQADATGRFTIKNIRPGRYGLYAWVPGFLGDYKHPLFLTIAPGDKQDVGKFVYQPPRNGSTVWEIGIPDRRAEEFFVPDPYPTEINRLFINQPANRFRQYGLWRRYTDLNPRGDLVYDVAKSNFSKDWYYAHVNRIVGNSFRVTTWQVLFNLPEVNSSPTKSYTLLIALAAANSAHVQARFNDPEGRNFVSTGRVGKDNAMVRLGIHGLYQLHSFPIPGSWLRKGNNVMYLKQAAGEGPFNMVMYDYLRLEAPPA